jgi:hypothetical protein
VSEWSKGFREKFLHHFDEEDFERLRSRKTSKDIDSLIRFVRNFKSEIIFSKTVNPNEFHVKVRVSDTECLYLSGDST